MHSVQELQQKGGNVERVAVLIERNATAGFIR